MTHTEEDIDRILAAVENPTRRRILQALAREPCYPLRLSKELGVSQQAVMKNLAVMEGCGIVASRREPGSRGPGRIVYRPGLEFSITIDMCSGMFRARMAPIKDRFESKEGPSGLKAALETVAEIDGRIEALDAARSELVRERSRIVSAFMGGASTLDGDGRAVLYEMLDRPGRCAEEISHGLMANERAVKELMAKITDIFKGRTEDDE
ncbi:MAG: helix-turn-helix domain-containing protein [Candidatus Methanoplasma sp.]|jgi:predicted transcriptional regulator|nr:helix-turn-helix domain-containing protein [Candidatus Methanoplasma sp.]